MFSAMLFYLNYLVQLSTKEDLIQIVYSHALTNSPPHLMVDRQL